jgi:hypothetical protein
VRCPRCGNENSDENRFCGMCGGTLLPPPGPIAAAPAQAAPRSSTIPSGPSAPSPVSSVASPSSSSAQPHTPASGRTSAPVSDEQPNELRTIPGNVPQHIPQHVPHISGPSFLGLNDPAPRKRASLSIDPHGAPSSSNLDYLLEDEEEPRSGGAGKFVLIVVALALAVGLGYLRWKNHGFPSLGSGASKPSAVAQNSDPTDASATTASNPASSSPTTPASQPAGSPASAADNSSSGGGATSAPAGATPAATTPSSANPSTNPAGGAAAPATAASPSPLSSSPSSPSSSSATGAANPAPDAASAVPAPGAAAPPATDDAAAPALAHANPKPSPEGERLAKPHAAIQPVRPVDRVAEAQKYIYGRGVTQDCERGMRLLKPAADQANPAAMVEMGALYSAGLCTPHDLPTAYRWFALALRKDPDNMAVQTDLQKLWGEMTQPERQLAIKLSQ